MEILRGKTTHSWCTCHLPYVPWDNCVASPKSSKIVPSFVLSWMSKLVFSAGQERCDGDVPGPNDLPKQVISLGMLKQLPRTSWWSNKQHSLALLEMFGWQVCMQQACAHVPMKKWCRVACLMFDALIRSLFVANFRERERRVPITHRT